MFWITMLLIWLGIALLTVVFFTIAYIHSVNREVRREMQQEAEFQMRLRQVDHLLDEILNTSNNDLHETA